MVAKRTFPEFLTALLLVLCSAALTLYAADMGLRYTAVGKRRVHRARAPTVQCPTTEKLLEEHGGADKVYGDGGFRNLGYTPHAPDFIQAWADTMCLNRHSYRDGESFIRVSPFANATYALNKYGRRGRDWDDAVDGDAIRVFLIGGSTAFSLLTKEAASIHVLLEEQLNRDVTGQKYYVFNAALPGATATDELNILEHEVADYRPSIVVFLTGVNNGGRGEGEYALVRNPEGQGRRVTLHALLGRLGLTNLQHLIQIPTTVKMQARDALTTFENASREFCRKAGIRCLFALQPTLLVERHAQSAGEQDVRQRVFESTTGVTPANYEPDYDVFDGFFRNPEHGFEYLDLRALGARGLSGGWMQPQQSQLFEKNDFRGKVKLAYRGGTHQPFSIQADGRELARSACSTAFLELSGVDNYTVRCSVRGYGALKEYVADTSSGEGYEKILFAATDDAPVLLRIPTLQPAMALEMRVLMKNYKDAGDLTLSASMSYDGARFSEPITLTRSYLDADFPLSWALDPSRGSQSLVVKLAFRASGHIGVGSLTYAVSGRVPGFDLAGPFTLVNTGKAAVLAVQAHKQSPAEVFIDAAHLTDGGNAVAAELIAQKILGKR